MMFNMCPLRSSCFYMTTSLGINSPYFSPFVWDTLDDWKNYLLTRVSGTSVARIESLSSLICPTSLNENVIRPLC